MNVGTVRASLAIVLVCAIAFAGFYIVFTRGTDRTHIVAYFENSNGVFAGDDVRIRGVTVGRIEAIEPQPDEVKITFWVDAAYPVAAHAKAVILSPTLVPARAIQLTPPYESGPRLDDNAVIGMNRTAVPMEWDDFRTQLERLTESLQPTESNDVSTLGALINSTADNLRGQGPAIRRTIIELSQTLSALGDHSSDMFSSVRNLANLVSALTDSTALMAQLNHNLAAVTGLLADDPGEVAGAIRDLNSVVGEVTSFVADNRESLGTSSDQLASVSQVLVDSIEDLKQLLHVAPTAQANLINVYQPAQGTLSGALAANNFSDPITFLCGAIQAASRLNAEQSSKLCVQYLAPIVKNRQFNFLPLGLNPFVGASARPNELTYSEDWMRPDFIPPPLAAEANHTVHQTNPIDGLSGLMVPRAEGAR
jgi:phospholipid/cholesterol/gamma-HCH transport system substrate-binding protein